MKMSNKISSKHEHNKQQNVVAAKRKYKTKLTTAENLQIHLNGIKKGPHTHEK